jgi:hypothetical protein
MSSSSSTQSDLRQTDLKTPIASSSQNSAIVGVVLPAVAHVIGPDAFDACGRGLAPDGFLKKPGSP